jgi:hypothetical protein
MDFYISEQEVRGKIPDMTGRKRRRPTQKSLFHAGLMDFFIFSRRSTENDFPEQGRNGRVRRDTEGYGEIRYLIFATVAVFVSVVAASNYPLRISP